MDGAAPSGWSTAGDAGQPNFTGFHSISNAELDALLQSYVESSTTSTNDTHATDFRSSTADFSNEALTATPRMSARDFSGARDDVASHQGSSSDSNSHLLSRHAESANAAKSTSSLHFSTFMPEQNDQRRNHPNGSAPTQSQTKTQAVANDFFPTSDLPRSLEWSKIGIPASLANPSILQDASVQFMIPNQMKSSVRPLAFARNENVGIQPGRASWDGTTTGSPMGYGMPQSGFDPANHAPHMSQQGSQQGMTAQPLGSEGESSDAGNTSAGSTKRRRMTVTGSDSLHQAGRGRPHIHPHQSQDSQQKHLLSQNIQTAIQRPRKHLDELYHHPSSASSSLPYPQGPSSSGLINSKELEQIASATLQRANAENRRTTDSEGHLSALPANLAGGDQQHLQQQQEQHQQQNQHSQSQRPPLHRQRSATSDQDGSYRTLQKRYSGPDLSDVFESTRQSASSVAAQQASLGGPAYHNASTLRPSKPGHMGGSAASHPPGLGSAVLRGQDPAISGSAAANDFTRRKGWVGRVVDELLDFAHVLDTEGNFMYATNSVQALTGWKATELKGMNIYNLVHPQDLPALRRELHSAIEDPAKEITMYYRIKRNPGQIETRAKARLASASHERHRLERSRSSSDAATSPTDTSSLQTPSESISGAASGSADQSSSRRDSRQNAGAEGEADPDAEWVTMEMTGHGYFPPTAVAKERAEEKQQYADGQNRADLMDSFMANPHSAADLGSFFETNEAGEEASSNRGSLDEDRKPRGAAMANRSPNKRTYELPLEREGRASCLFCSCRVYPTKSVLLLDSFLELKMENEKLRLELEQLNLSEEREGTKPSRPGSGPSSQRPSLDGNAHDVRREQDGSLVMSPDGGIEERSQDETGGRNSLDVNQLEAAKPRPGDPSALQGGVGAAERALHASPAGLSRGLSTMSGQVTVNEASGGSSEDIEAGGSSSPSAADGSNSSAKKKKGKAQDDDEDRVCTDCGRTDSPEWRKGPLGPKTLCNACGLRYAKKIKRQPTSLHMSGPSYPGATSPADLAHSPPRPTSAIAHGPVSQAAARAISGGGGGVNTPMPSMNSSHASRPAYSTMNSFATDISSDHRPNFGGAGGMDGSFHSVPMESGGSFHQMSHQQHPHTPFRGDFTDSHEVTSYGSHQPIPQFSPDYSMTPQQQHSAAASMMRHQSSQSYGGYPSFQQQLQQQAQQAAALQQHQQQEMQEMQQRHQHQIRQQMQQQLSQQQHQQQGHGGNENGNGW
ncbi:unnamed protein product [Sympodiomycopsis kandeliae]